MVPGRNRTRATAMGLRRAFSPLRHLCSSIHNRHSLAREQLRSDVCTFRKYSRTYRNQPLKMLSLGGRSRDRSVSKFCLITILQLHVETYRIFFIHIRVDFKKNYSASHRKISVSCAIQEYDNCRFHTRGRTYRLDGQIVSDE